MEADGESAAYHQMNRTPASASQAYVEPQGVPVHKMKHSAKHREKAARQMEIIPAPTRAVYLIVQRLKVAHTMCDAVLRCSGSAHPLWF